MTSPSSSSLAASSTQVAVDRSDNIVPESISIVLRAEALLELLLAVSAYHYLGGSWPLFTLLFLLPDLSILGYLVNPRLGAQLYNLGHTHLVPAFLALSGFVLATPLLYSLSLIWAAHIGLDRMLGYGLKYPVGFKMTHLSWKRDAHQAVVEPQ
ncbi:hypothetical protein FHW67_002358 [Herbaspirillum sp. Sphag1AN]|uniref:DUF4260 family protein n=1 Tax=unclassified Herbaspirillum TaxID=2624150 RepID=UPI001607A274|nr:MULTISPECIES: DUF4260 family protein [unclassified Herbaspirillum]MBB3213069.1 hypothetical protein [Herbaspirillum sp. Sphag1AN]MBB3246266.1 hypothetical protein [Herbaspirillum sp. Sphag64]